MISLKILRDIIESKLLKIDIRDEFKTLAVIVTIFTILSTVLFGCKQETAVFEKSTQITEGVTEPTPEVTTTEEPTTETEEAFKIEYPVTVTDDVGKEVTLTEYPDKIISLAP
ncbi:unnamed protein product, partial [marine sediment metagenome]